jgi:uncharacterized protein (TIGR01244 family)
MANFISIVPGFAVAGQLTRDDFAAAAEAGFKAILNNRPDGEAPGQLPSAEAATEAQKAGLAYHAIPVDGAPTPAAVEATIEALASGGPVLAYCRTGRRSAALWALAQAKTRARSPEEIVRLAAAAGYDLSGLRQALEALGRT